MKTKKISLAPSSPALTPSPCQTLTCFLSLLFCFFYNLVEVQSNIHNLLYLLSCNQHNNLKFVQLCLLLFIVKLHSIVWIYYYLFIHSEVDLGCIWFGASLFKSCYYE